MCRKEDVLWRRLGGCLREALGGHLTHLFLPSCMEQLYGPYDRWHVGVRSMRPAMAGMVRLGVRHQAKEQDGAAAKPLQRTIQTWPNSKTSVEGLET